MCFVWFALSLKTNLREELIRESGFVFKRFDLKKIWLRLKRCPLELICGLESACSRYSSSMLISNNHAATVRVMLSFISSLNVAKTSLRKKTRGPFFVVFL